MRKMESKEGRALEPTGGSGSRRLMHRYMATGNSKCPVMEGTHGQTLVTRGMLLRRMAHAFTLVEEAVGIDG